MSTITGSVAINFNDEGSGFKPKTDSRYVKIEAETNNMAYGKDIPNQISCEAYAEKVVGHILGGVSGKIWRGGNANASGDLSAIAPQIITVRLQ